MTTYTQLKSGDWGLRVQGPPPAPGAVVTVTKKSGETKKETVGQVIWTGNGVSLCAIQRTRPPSYGRYRGGYDPADCCPCSRTRDCYCGSDAPCCMCD